MKIYFLSLITLLFYFNPGLSQEVRAKKVLLIGIDGVINTAIEYASTPGIDKLISKGSYSMKGFTGLPVGSTTGWATLMTGVYSDKHGILENGDFHNNNLDEFPSIVDRIKEKNPDIKIASIIRDDGINKYLNSAADLQLSLSTDDEVHSNIKEILQNDDFDVVVSQFSSPKEIGATNGYQLRLASYVLAIQKIDNYIDDILEVLQAREAEKNEDWAVFLVSTHGGTESGILSSTTSEEILVPIIFHGKGIDNKKLLAESQEPKIESDNYISIKKAASDERTYVRVPIKNTELQGMDRFTIEMWIKPGVNSSDPVIFGDSDWGSGNNPGFIVCRVGSSWKINHANDKRRRYDIGSSAVIEDGNWHHIAITFDKTKECVLYQDGVRVGGATLTYDDVDDMSSMYDYINLAQDGTETYGGGGPNWNGAFNEVRIWADILSAEIIKKYMHKSKLENSSHPNLESLKLYLKMDETQGSMVHDYSGNNNHAEIVGPATSRHPFYPVSLIDVAVNIFNYLDVKADSSWGLNGTLLKSNLPYRLFKIR